MSSLNLPRLPSIFPTNTHSHQGSRLNLPQQLPSLSCLDLELPARAVIHPGLENQQPSRQGNLISEEPTKKQGKWTPKEDEEVIQLRTKGLKWVQVADYLPGRSPLSCRLRYQNHLEERVISEKKENFARIYDRYVRTHLVVTISNPDNILYTKSIDQFQGIDVAEGRHGYGDSMAYSGGHA